MYDVAVDNLKARVSGREWLDKSLWYFYSFTSTDNDIISLSRHVPVFLTLILNICRMCVGGWLDLHFKDNLLAD